MSEITPLFLQKTEISKKFKFGKILDISDFSWVFEGKNILKNVPVSIKKEKKKVIIIFLNQKLIF